MQERGKVDDSSAETRAHVDLGNGGGRVDRFHSDQLRIHTRVLEWMSERERERMSGRVCISVG